MKQVLASLVLAGMVVAQPVWAARALSYTVSATNWEDTGTGQLPPIYMLLDGRHVEMLSPLVTCQPVFLNRIEVSSDDGIDKVRYDLMTSQKEIKALGVLERLEGQLRLDYSFGTQVKRAMVAPPGPVILYELKFADLNGFVAGLPAGQDFEFSVAQWPDAEGKPVSSSPHVVVHRIEQVTWNDRQAYLYAVSGALTGQIWIDTERHHILEARIDETADSKLTPFHIVLSGDDSDGKAAWRGLKKQMWGNC